MLSHFLNEVPWLALQYRFELSVKMTVANLPCCSSGLSKQIIVVSMGNIASEHFSREKKHKVELPNG